MMDATHTMPSVLVVDDEPDVRRSIVDTLAYGGYKTLNAGNGSMAVELAQEHLPDVIISDINMPHMNGYDVLEALRDNERTNTIPVILLTSMSDRQTMRQGMERGADDFLTKPFTVKELLAAVESQLTKQARIAEKHDTTMRILRKNIIYALPHEMRTPLQQIMGYAYLLATPDSIPQADEVVAMSESIVEASQRLQRLMENYLTYAQLELIGDNATEIKALRNHITPHIGSIIYDAARIKAQAFNREADLVADVCDLALRISEDNMSKIISELVDNAFKFSQPGTRVHVRAENDQNTLWIRIEDQGRGISTEQIQGMGAYMQFDRKIYEQQGLGLGYAIARRLVMLHKGRIHVESDVGQGTIIDIALPIYS